LSNILDTSCNIRCLPSSIPGSSSCTWRQYSWNS